MPLLDGPRLPPRSGGAPDALVVLLHGYGADGRDLIDIGGAWADLLPGAAFVAPHAPDPCTEAPVGRQWFPLSRMDLKELARGVEAAAPGIEQFLCAELERLRLPPSRLALVGFSQGSMMALNVALRMRAAPGVVVAYSGLWAGAAREAEAHPAPPPILLLHGSEDQVIPAEALFASSYGLAGAGVPVEWHLSHGLGHGIDEVGLTLGGDFIARNLSRRS
ncbi:dienelactone hydrolase family protein [Aquabacter sp. CN5-332]|uniref:alpha/beta hydrolase n=1 Tax=Aquabacter sp. CN5-332 TaxID=3156608 RepID=UPI0032B529B8